MKGIAATLVALCALAAAAPADAALGNLDARIQVAIDASDWAASADIDGQDGDTPTMIVAVHRCSPASPNRQRCLVAVHFPSRKCMLGMIAAKRRHTTSHVWRVRCVQRRKENRSTARSSTSKGLFGHMPDVAPRA